MKPDHQQETADKQSLLWVLDLLDDVGIRYWVEGGWGVDVLVGKQSRAHRDIDIDFDAAHEAVLLGRLQQAGYRITTDWRPCRVEPHHPEHGYIDVHPLQISESGNAKQAAPNGGWYQFQAGWFTTAVFEGRKIPCLSAQAQLLFHSGYDLREVDEMDIALLHQMLHSPSPGKA